MKIREIMANIRHQGKETVENTEEIFYYNPICPKDVRILKECQGRNCRKCYDSENKG